MQRWVTAYQEVLKTKIALGTFTFWNKDQVRTYEGLPVSEWGGLWGREAGGGIYTKHLIPEKLTQFVPGDTRAWVNAMKLIPSETEGNIEMLSIFWNSTHPLFTATMKYPNVVPPLLVYADLITSMDSRNRETAKKINAYNLSKNRVPEYLIDVIVTIQEVLGEMAYYFILIGTAARDVILDGLHHKGIKMATTDVK